jgi:hypothetical protein
VGGADCLGAMSTSDTSLSLSVLCCYRCMCIRVIFCVIGRCGWSMAEFFFLFLSCAATDVCVYVFFLCDRWAVVCPCQKTFVSMPVLCLLQMYVYMFFLLMVYGMPMSETSLCLSVFGCCRCTCTRSCVCVCVLYACMM